MEKPQKIMVREYGPHLYDLISRGDTLEEIITVLEEHMGLGFIGVDCQDGEDYDEYYERRLYLLREETDKEYNLRIKQDEIMRKKKEKKKEDRRKLYELLREEFA